MNLSIGFGEVGGEPLTNGESEAGPDAGVFDSYSTVRTDLIDKRALGASTLPTGSSIQGESQAVVWSTQEKLFGQLAPHGSGLDGEAGFATDVQTITGTDVLVGVALHELTHAMGRVPYGPEPDILDLYRFTSAGTRLFSGAIPAPADAYFSINGGRTDDRRLRQSIPTPAIFSIPTIPLQAISRPRILLTSITTPIRFRRSPASILTNSACLDSVFQHPHRLEAPRLPKPAAAAQPVRHMRRRPRRRPVPGPHSTPGTR